MPNLIDTHAHLDDPQFTDVAAVIERAGNAGVRYCIAIGTTVASSAACIALAERFGSVFAAVGIHPNHCAEARHGDWEQILRMCEHPRVVGIGETGLDRHWDFAPFALQEDYFRRHIALSRQTGKPLVIHMRDCEADMLRVLQEAAAEKPLHGVMHSFTGSAEAARQCCDWGLYVSFAGMLTYKKSDDLRAIAADIPDDRLLIETDAPYLSPHPMRGQRPNEPALIVHTAGCLAEVRRVSLESLAEQTSENARRLFGLPSFTGPP